MRLRLPSKCLRFGLALLPLAFLLSGGCSCEDPIAELELIDGDVQRDESESVGTWQTAEVGAEFFLGDGVRTGPSSTARLLVTGAGALGMEEDTTVRFLASAPGEDNRRLSVESGVVEIEAAEASVELSTLDGQEVIVGRGGRTRLETGDDGPRITVVVGSAEVIVNGESTTLEEGDYIVDIGSAEVVPWVAAAEREPVEDPEPPPPDTPDDAAGGVRALVRGAAARVRETGEPWQTVAIGEIRIGVGASVEVPTDGSVELSRGDETAVLGPGAYSVGAEGSSVARATRGRVTITANREDVVLQIPGGTVIARAADGGSVASVDVGAEESIVEAERGTVDVRGPDIEETLTDGESATVAHAAPSTEPDDSLDEPPPQVNYDRSPDYRDFTAQAGDSFTVRDPRPPTSIGFFLPSQCGEGGVIELMAGRRVRRSYRGDATVNVLFRRGRHAYRVRCDGSSDVLSEGTIRVIRDSGRGAISRVAPPPVPVEADGRRYTVLYQNRLPQIRARWRDAPSGDVRLEIVSRGRTRTVAAPRGRHNIPSGRMRQGTHQITFVAGARRSPTTTIRIQFDNAAEVARITSPDEGSFRPGEPVQVSGNALAGWQVRVGGAELPLDRAHRFEETVPTSAGQRAIAIRVTAPGRGANVYVRHGSVR